MTDKEKLLDLRCTVEHSYTYCMNAIRDVYSHSLAIEANIYNNVLKWIDDLIKDNDDGMLTKLSEKEALECNDWEEAAEKEFFNLNVSSLYSTKETFIRGFQCGQYWRQQIDEKDEELSRLWKEYHNVCKDCTVGNGCDDCRDCESAQKKYEIYKKIKKIEQ